MEIKTNTFTRMSRFGLGVLCTLLLSATQQVQAQTQVWPTRLTNMAAAANGGRIVSSTSTLDNDPKFSAENLIDGQVFNPLSKTGSFGWASNKFDPISMDSVTIGFADNRAIMLGKLVFNPTVAVAAERWAKDIEVQASSDSVQGPYRVVGQITLRKAAEPQEFIILPTEARFVRLVFRSNWGSDRAVALGEVEMYEAVDTSDPLGGLIARLEGAIKELKIYRQLQLQLNSTGTRTGKAEGKSDAIENVSLSSSTRAMLQLVQNETVVKPAELSVSNKNIAAAANGGKIVGYSSVFNNNEKDYGPQNLIDGQNFFAGATAAENKGSFGWASEGFAPMREFVTIGFAGDKPHSISKIVVNPVSNQSQLRWARTLIMQVTSGTPKEGPWRTVETFNVNQEPVSQEFTFSPIEARYVRFLFAANGPASLALPNADPRVISDRAVSLGEIEIYEPVAVDDNLEQLISKLNQILIDMKQLDAVSRLTPREDSAQPATGFVQPEANLNRLPVERN